MLCWVFKTCQQYVSLTKGFERVCEYYVDHIVLIYLLLTMLSSVDFLYKIRFAWFLREA